MLGRCWLPMPWWLVEAQHVNCPFWQISELPTQLPAAVEARAGSRARAKNLAPSLRTEVGGGVSVGDTTVNKHRKTRSRSKSLSHGVLGKRKSKKKRARKSESLFCPGPSYFSPLAPPLLSPVGSPRRPPPHAPSSSLLPPLHSALLLPHPPPRPVLLPLSSFFPPPALCARIFLLTSFCPLLSPIASHCSSSSRFSSSPPPSSTSLPHGSSPRS